MERRGWMGSGRSGHSGRRCSGVRRLAPLGSGQARPGCVRVKLAQGFCVAQARQGCSMMREEQCAWALPRRLTTDQLLWVT